MTRLLEHMSFLGRREAICEEIEKNKITLAFPHGVQGEALQPPQPHRPL